MSTRSYARSYPWKGANEVFFFDGFHHNQDALKLATMQLEGVDVEDQFLG